MVTLTDILAQAQAYSPAPFDELPDRANYNFQFHTDDYGLLIGHVSQIVNGKEVKHCIFATLNDRINRDGRAETYVDIALMRNGELSRLEQGGYTTEFLLPFRYILDWDLSLVTVDVFEAFVKYCFLVRGYWTFVMGDSKKLTTHVAAAVHTIVIEQDRIKKESDD